MMKLSDEVEKEMEGFLTRYRDGYYGIYYYRAEEELRSLIEKAVSDFRNLLERLEEMDDEQPSGKTAKDVIGEQRMINNAMRQFVDNKT